MFKNSSFEIKIFTLLYQAGMAFWIFAPWKNGLFHSIFISVTERGADFNTLSDFGRVDAAGGFSCRRQLCDIFYEGAAGKWLK